MLPTCPKCNSLAIGDVCGTCGTPLSLQTVKTVDLGTDAAVETSGSSSGTGRRQASAYLALEPSETAVLHAASRIFAAFIASGVVNDANQHELSDRSVKLATRMALVIEKYIQSDGEDW